MKIVKEGKVPAGNLQWWAGQTVTCERCGAVWMLEKGDLVFAHSDSADKASFRDVIRCFCPTAGCLPEAILLRRKDVVDKSVLQTVVSASEWLARQA